MSACSVGPSGFQPSRSRVSALDADMSFDTKAASQPKCAPASSALTDVAAGRRFRRSSRRSRGRESLFEVGQFVTELCATSPEFAALWADNDVRFHGEGTKRLHHPVLGAMELEYSGFAVDGRPDLGMIVYNPVDPDMADRIRSILAG